MTTEFFVTVIRSYEREDLTLLKISKKEVVKQMALTGQNEDNWKSFVSEYLQEVPELLDKGEIIEKGALMSQDDLGPEVGDVDWV
jgi:GTPase Era involved in 16S rRNA processing|tara:strand:+ start:87 stop:341 length:255 start_codon:yes stop_codon:yes gene_type:complete